MKKVVALILTLLMVFAVAACTSKPQTPNSGEATDKPQATQKAPEPGTASKGKLKVGVLAALSGNPAVMGQDAKQAIQLYCEMNNYNLGGYEIELFIEDDEDNANTTVTKCSKLVEQDGVDIILGPQNAGSALAIADYMAENEVPLLLYHGPVDAITKTAANDYMVRTQLSASQGGHAMGDYAYNHLNLRKAALMSYDFTFGYQLCGGFQRVFEELGGEVVSRQFAPIGLTDYGPMFSNINWDEIDCLVFQYSGGDGTRFFQQLIDYGITEKENVTLLCLQNGVDELFLRELPVGIANDRFYSVACWSPDCDNDVNRDFVKLYNEKFGYNPSCHSENAFCCMTALKLALESGVDPYDGAALVKTIRSLTNIAVPRGVIYRFDEYGQAVTDICIRKLGAADGKLFNTLIYTYPEVSQFWHWDPIEFMSWPEYTVDYPPITSEKKN